MSCGTHISTCPTMSAFRNASSEFAAYCELLTSSLPDSIASRLLYHHIVGVDSKPENLLSEFYYVKTRQGSLVAETYYVDTDLLIYLFRPLINRWDDHPSCLRIIKVNILMLRMTRMIILLLWTIILMGQNDGSWCMVHGQGGRAGPFGHEP